jgi:hypothetical protein
VNVQNRRSSRRKGQAMVLTVCGLGAAAASALAYLLSSINGREAVILPWIVMGPVVFGISLHRRAQRRQEWSTAWDAYLLASDAVTQQTTQ